MTCRRFSRLACAGLLLLVLGVREAGAESAPAYVLSWGSSGSGPGQFRSAGSIAVDSQGCVYVADTGNDRVQKFDTNGGFIREWGSTGCSQGEFQSPIAIAVDANDFVYVAHWGGSATLEAACRCGIQKFTSEGQFVARWGALGNAAGELNGPFGLDIDENGNVYITEFNVNNRVQKFAPDGASLRLWNGAPGPPGPFHNPTGIAVGGGGQIFVSDWGSPTSTDNTIYVFDTDGIQASWFGGYGSGPGQFSEPSGLDVDAAGNLYVADRANSRVQKLSAAGVPLAAWGSQGSGPGQFDYVWDLAVDLFGNVFVFDEGNSRIEKFTYNTSGVSERPLTPGVHVTAWPNPSAGDFLIQIEAGGSISGARGGSVTLDLFDLQGRHVRSLGRRILGIGSTSLLWDGRTDAGIQGGAGIYLLRARPDGAPSVTTRLVSIR